MLTSRKCAFLLALTLLVIFSALQLSVSLRYAICDNQTTPQWRAHRNFDDTQNAVRAESIQRYGYHNDPVLPIGLQQFFLMTSLATHYLVPEHYPPINRFQIALRSTAALCFVGCWAVFLWISWQLFSPWAALITWLCFVAGSGHYASTAYFAKENSMAVLFCLATLVTWISHFRKPANWKLFLSAVWIGMGGATKQYPLLLAPLLVPMLWRAPGSWGRRGALLGALAVVTVLAMLLPNPNLFLKSSELAILAAGTQSMDVNYLETLRQCWRILQIDVLRLHAHLWVLAGLLWIAIWLFEKRVAKARVPSFDFLRRNALVIALYLVGFYALSLYKQNYYSNVTYFMVGELAWLLIYGALFDRALALTKPRVRGAVIGLAVLAAARLCWSTGHFNHTTFLYSREQYVYELGHSTADLLAEQLTLQQGEGHKLTLATWYVPLARPFPPVRFSLFALGEPSRFTDALQIPVSYEAFDLAMVRKWKPAFLATYEPVPPDLGCASLLRRFDPDPLPQPSNYLSAVLKFHHAFAASGSRLGGPPLFLYDASKCL